MPIAVRAARTEDWPAVAALLVELGRGVAVGTAEDPTHRMQFGAISAGWTASRWSQRSTERWSASSTWSTTSGWAIIDRRRASTIWSFRSTPAAPARAVSSSGGPKRSARKRGCFRMALVTAGWRESTIAFYRGQGWVDYGAWFVKPLTDDVAASGQACRRQLIRPRAQTRSRTARS